MHRLPALKPEDALIAIDSGNSRIKAGLFVRGRLLQLYRAPRAHAPEPHRLRTWLQSESRPKRAMCLETARLPDAWSSWLKAFRVELYFFPESARRLPPTDYQQPRSWGADRQAACLGAQKRFPRQDLLIVDAGTCITYDLWTGPGRQRGGAISPGMRMRLKSMHAFTAGLPEAPMPPVGCPMLGRSTYQALQSGVLHGAAFEIQSFFRRWQRNFPQLKLVLSGGDAPYLSPLIENRIFAEPNLNLHGLYQSLDPSYAA